MLEDYINEKINEAYDYMQNDTEKSLEIFDELLEIEPENIDALNGKGSALMKLNEYGKAEKYFNQSLSICENSSALLNKGIIFKHQKDFDKALTLYNKALKINPNLKNIINILKSEISQANERELNDQPCKLIQKGIELKDANKLWDALDMFKKALEADFCYNDEANEYITELKTIFEKEFIYGDCEFDINRKIDRVKMQALKALVNKNPKKALTLINLVLEMDENDINAMNHKEEFFLSAVNIKRPLIALTNA